MLAKVSAPPFYETPKQRRRREIVEYQRRVDRLVREHDDSVLFMRQHQPDIMTEKHFSDTYILAAVEETVAARRLAAAEWHLKTAISLEREVRRRGLRV